MSADGAYPVFGANGLIGRYHRYNHEEPEVLLGCRGSCGTVNVSLPKSWVTGNAMVVRPRDSRLTKDFLRYFLDGSEAISKVITGVAQPQITQKSLSVVQIPLPPLEDQRRIVMVLDEAFAAIANTIVNAERNLANARNLFESYGEVLFSDLMNSRIEHVELGKLTAPGSGITYGVIKPGGEGSVAFVRGGDLVDGAVRMDRLRTITQDISQEYSRTLLIGGELLICLVGTPGQCAIAPKELAGANIARQVGMIRLGKELEAEYVRDYLLSLVGQRALGLKTGGSVQQVINLGDLKLIEIPVPDVRMQSEIVEKIRLMKMSVIRLEECYRAKLAELDALRQSLLERAFSGELAENEAIAA